MRRALQCLLPLLALGLAAPQHGEELGFIMQYHGFTSPGMAAAFAEGDKADFQAYYDHDGSLRIRSRASIAAGGKPVLVSLDESIPFWNEHARGKFVCVTLCKNVWSEDQVKETVTRITRTLFDAGVRRVRVHQGLGSGVGVLADTTKKRSPEMSPVP